MSEAESFVIYRCEALAFGRAYQQQGFIVERGLPQQEAESRCQEMNDKRTQGQVRRGVKFAVKSETEAAGMKNLKDVSRKIGNPKLEWEDV
jgi:hypothetical protein